MGPYAYKGNQWVGYDTIDYVKMKANFINNNELGGAMFWDLSTDDFNVSQFKGNISRSFLTKYLCRSINSRDVF